MAKFTQDEIISILHRLKKSCEVKSEGGLASLLGIKPTALSQQKGRGSLPLELIYVFCSQKGINVNWVMTGTGPMFTNPADPEQQRVDYMLDHGGKAPVLVTRPAHDGQEKSNSIDDLLQKTRRVLISNTIYRKALESNILAFDRGVGMEDEVGLLHNKIDQMANDMAEMKAFIMQGPEKKSLAS